MLKACVFAAGCAPLGWAVYQVLLLQTGASHTLGADPAKALVLMQGEWAIRFLLLTLLVTPLRRVTGWNGVQKVRRMLGLFTFFYASLHLTAYTVLLLELDFANLWADIGKRPYITVGFTAWLLLLPLAVTSTQAMMRRLGRHWVVLHRAVYAVALLAVVHVFWLARSSYAEAVFYGVAVAVLLLARLLGPRLPLFQQAIKPSL